MLLCNCYFCTIASKNPQAFLKNNAQLKSMQNRTWGFLWIPWKDWPLVSCRVMKHLCFQGISDVSCLSNCQLISPVRAIYIFWCSSSPWVLVFIGTADFVVDNFKNCFSRAGVKVLNVVPEDQCSAPSTHRLSTICNSGLPSVGTCTHVAGTHTHLKNKTPLYQTLFVCHS